MKDLSTFIAFTVYKREQPEICVRTLAFQGCPLSKENLICVLCGEPLPHSLAVHNSLRQSVMEVLASAVAIRTSVLSSSTATDYYHSSCRRTQVAPGRRVSFNSAALRHHEGLRKSSTVDVLRPISLSEGFDIAVNSHLSSTVTTTENPSRGVISAVFERFTERAIKSVMLAQREAKALGRREVGTEQLLLGLIAEERGNEGYLSSGVTIERAREAVKSLLDESVGSGLLGPATEVPFSHGSKRVFEAALEHSKKMGHNYIAPEHIAIALLAVDDGGASKVLDRFDFSPLLVN